MAGQSPQVDAWKQTEGWMQAGSGGWTIQLNPARPDLGLFVIRIPSQSKSHSESRSRTEVTTGSTEEVDSELDALRYSALTVRPQPSHSFLPEEIYVRQQDLIARFGQSDIDQYAIQLNWRLLPAQEPFDLAVEVWVSIQTQLLDSAPVVQLLSEGPSVWRAWESGDLNSDYSSDDPPTLTDAVALLSASEGANLLWLIDPRDQAKVHRMDDTPSNRYRSSLFGDFLEKGVIRRARLRLLVGSKHVELSDIRSAYQDLCSSALPLTA